MKKNLPLIVGALALLAFFLKSGRTYKVITSDDADAFIILKEGGKYYEFAIPVANIGKPAGKIHPQATLRTAADYAALKGPEYKG